MNPQYPPYPNNQPYQQPYCPAPIPPQQPSYQQPTYYPQQYPNPQPMYCPTPPPPQHYQPPQQPIYSPSPYGSTQQLYQYPYPYVFNPSSFTETYNPWSANIWLQNYPVQPSPSQISSQSQQSPEIFKFESIEQFQKLRQHASIESALNQLSEVATDLSNIDPNSFNPPPASCFIICNSYTKPTYKLGVGPINDAITVASNHKFMGFTVYYLHNPHHTLFLKFLKVFLQKVTQYLTIFYTGHGAQMKDASGDEGDGYDEVVIFDSGNVVDDQLAKYLNKYCNGYAHTILLSDCCHSGTIWDIPEDISIAQAFPPNIMSISAAKDNQTAKQKSIEKNSQGIFTFNFWTVVRNNPGINIRDIQRLLDPELRKFNQQLEYYPTRLDMLDMPVFPLMIQN